MKEKATNTVNIRGFFRSKTNDYKKSVLIANSNVVSKVKEALAVKGFTMPATIVELKAYEKRNSIPVTTAPS